jgi:C4-dicarboxylate-specific signal transduction histidine kinase
MRGGVKQRLVTLTAVVALPLALYIGYQIVHLYQELSDAALGAADRDARIVSASLERYVVQLADEGRSVGLAITRADLSRAQADEYLLGVNRHVAADNIAVLSLEGDVLGSVLEDAAPASIVGLPAFRQVVEGASFSASSLRTNADGEPGLAVLASVGDPLEAVVVLSSTGSTSRLWSRSAPHKAS